MLQRNYLLAFLIFCSVSSAAQSLDSSLISQLTPEQIEKAKQVYAEQNSSDVPVTDLPVIDESLVEKNSSDDANEVSGKKYGYDFFSSMLSFLINLDILSKIAFR